MGQVNILIIRIGIDDYRASFIDFIPPLVISKKFTSQEEAKEHIRLNLEEGEFPVFDYITLEKLIKRTLK